MKRKSGPFGGNVPKRDLDRLVEGEAERALIAAAWPIDPMDERCGRLSDERGPGFYREDPNDLVVVGQRVEQ